MARTVKQFKDSFEVPPIPSDPQERYDLLVKTVNDILAKNPPRLEIETTGERLFWQEIFNKITNDQWQAMSEMRAEFRRAVVFFLVAIEGMDGFDGVYRIMLGPWAAQVRDRYNAEFATIAQDAEERVMKARNEAADAIMEASQKRDAAIATTKAAIRDMESARGEAEYAQSHLRAVREETEKQIDAAEKAQRTAEEKLGRVVWDLAAVQGELAETTAKLATLQGRLQEARTSQANETQGRLDAERTVRSQQTVIESLVYGRKTLEATIGVMQESIRLLEEQLAKTA